MFLSTNSLIAGKIKNLNIKTSGDATVTVQTDKDSEIDSVNVKKDADSKVIINGKEVNCEENADGNEFCTPDLMY
jgi:hypothetical protein